jgi:hypothetical protein
VIDIRGRTREPARSSRTRWPVVVSAVVTGSVERTVGAITTVWQVRRREA